MDQMPDSAMLQVKLVICGKEDVMASNCDSCVNYVYDEDEECYFCLVNLDEDEMYRFLTGTQSSCPYYRLDDEYGVVRHQI